MQRVVEPLSRNIKSRDIEFANIFDGQPWSEDKLQGLSPLLSMQDGDTLGDLEHWLTHSEEYHNEALTLTILLRIIEYDASGFLREARHLLFEMPLEMPHHEVFSSP